MLVERGWGVEFDARNLVSTRSDCWHPYLETATFFWFTSFRIFRSAYKSLFSMKWQGLVLCMEDWTKNRYFSGTTSFGRNPGGLGYNWSFKWGNATSFEKAAGHGGPRHRSSCVASDSRRRNGCCAAAGGEETRILTLLGKLGRGSRAWPLPLGGGDILTMNVEK